MALGIGPGDEVITPSLSFVATSNAVLYSGAEARFADITSNDELTIDPDEISRLINRKTTAIMVMHYGGFPCRMGEILEIADRYKLPIIEDAAHAPGVIYRGRALGTWGTIGCFSFFSNKNLSTGEGGMLVTDRDDLAHKVRLMRSHGMTSLTYDRHHGHANSYDVVELGYNYRIDEIRAALGLEQLKKLSKNNALRKERTEQYWQLLSHLRVDLPFQHHEGSAAHHIFPMLLPKGVERKAFTESLKDEGIQTSVHYPAIHTFTYYRARFGKLVLPKTEEVAEREVTLPLYPGMGKEKVKRVADAVSRALNMIAAEDTTINSFPAVIG